MEQGPLGRELSLVWDQPFLSRPAARTERECVRATGRACQDGYGPRPEERRRGP